MKIKKKTFTVIAMRVRTPKLNIRSRSLEIDRFDLNDADSFFSHICNLPNNSGAQNLGDRFIFLEEFNDDYDNDFYSGWFVSARYGEVPDLIDARTLNRRENTKNITEGDENRTYFILEKSTGLFLLQSDNKRIVTGNAVNNYFKSKIEGFESYINEYNRKNHGNLNINKEAFIQFDFSIDTSFMEEVKRLARIKKTTIQCDITSGTGNQVIEAINNQLEGVEDYDQIEYSVAMKERGVGIKRIEKFIEGLQGQELYRNVIVSGTTTYGRPKIVSWSKHAKRYEVKVQINNNGLVYQDDIINRLIDLAKKEKPL